MPPFGRGLPGPGLLPDFPPLRPHSPTGAYLPAPGADMGTMDRHREMANHKYANFLDHPDTATQPSGGLSLGYAYADALMGFRAQVRSMPDQGQMYAQTYRIGNGEFVPVHPQPIKGSFAEVALPNGSYPPGTGLVIFSHPPESTGHGRSARPEPQELLRAYQDRTNALLGHGTNVGMHMLYDAGTDKAYAYDGRLGADGKPKFFQAIVPVAPQVRTEAILPEAFIPAPALGMPAGSAHAGPAHGSPERSPSPPSVPPSPKWDEWIDFNAGSGSHGPHSGSGT